MGVYEWNDNLIDLQYQERSEVEACRHTTQQDTKGVVSLTNLVNMFFRLAYYWGILGTNTRDSPEWHCRNLG
jgi:hypothetical protein